MINIKKNLMLFLMHYTARDGEDGIAQSYFEYLKIKYTHSGVISLHNCYDQN